MARPRTDDGRRVTLSFKVSEAKAAELEEARGMLSRSSVLEEALDLWLAQTGIRKPAARTRRTNPLAAREVPFSSAGR
jgi:hypothetical protein